MKRIHPRHLVCPFIAISTLLLLSISNSIAFYQNTHISLNNKLNQYGSNSTQDSLQLDVKYPESIQKWRNEIEKAAEAYSLDPNLIAAVMLQESGGQPSIISQSGAVGLMQIMPRDGFASGFICNSEPCFKDRPTIQELIDPKFNIDYGARMLFGLQKAYGSLRTTLKAYGPMDVGFSYADLVLSIYTNNQ